MSYNKLFHSHGKCSGVQQDLSVAWQESNDLVKHVLKILRQQLVGLQTHSAQQQSFIKHFHDIQFPHHYKLHISRKLTPPHIHHGRSIPTL